MNETTSEVETASALSVAGSVEKGRGGWRQCVLLPLGLSVLLTAVFFRDVAFTDRIFADRDTLIVYMPMFKYWAERILSGEWPDWFPYDGLGQPYAGAMLGMAFHPIKLLFLLTDVGTAMKWATLLCFPLAFNGMFLLCRALRLSLGACLMGGLLFAFNGYMVSLTNNIPYLLGMASLPWCWWLTVRVYRSPTFGRVALAAFSYALMLFTGEVQSFITACVTGLAFAFVLDGWEGRRKKAFGLYCAVMALACLMCAVQWVPALHAMSQGAPGGLAREGEAVFWSLHPFRFLDLLFDGMNGHGYESGRWFAGEFYRYDLGNYWTRSIYFGLVGVAFCAFAWWSSRRKAALVLTAGAAIAFLLCLGKYAGLYEALKVVPLFTPLRYPEKCLNLAMACLSLLAAYGFTALSGNEAPARVRRTVFAAAGGAALAFLLTEGAFHGFSGGLLSVVSASPEPVPVPVQDEVRGIFLSSLAVTLVAALAMAAVLRHRPSAFVPVALACCFLLQFASSSHAYTPTIPEVAAEASPPVLAIQAETAEGEAPRYMSVSRMVSAAKLDDSGLSEESGRITLMFLLSPVYASLYGLESYGKYYLPAASRRAIDLLKGDFRIDRSLLLARLFSVRHYVVFGGDYARMGGTVDDIAYEHPDLGSLVVRLKGGMPRAYLSRPRCVDGPEASEGLVMEGGVDFGSETVLECGGRSLAPAPLAGRDLGTASIAFRKPEHVAVDVDALEDGSVLVLTDAHYSGWKATIDGEPAEILPANHAVRGVMVPKGKHRVEFTYRTPGQLPAAAVSLGTMLASLVAGLAMSAFRRRKAGKGAFA